MKENDYVLGQGKENRKPFLIQIKELAKDTVTGILETDRNTNPQTVEVYRKDLFLNLGPTPTAGKAYGFDLANIYLKSFNHEFWGKIDFFTRLDKATMKMFRNALDRTAKVVEKQKLTPFVDIIRTEVRAKNGKYAGMYKHSKEDRLVWYAPAWCEGQSEQMDYVILHEFGHVLRYNGVTGSKLRAKWLKVFKRSIARTRLEPVELKAIMKALVTAHDEDPEAPFSKALKSAFEDDDNQQKLKTLVRWMKEVHHMAPKDLAVLWAADDLSFLQEKIWPTSVIDSSDLSPIISEYATRNCEETVAEAYSFYSTGKKLPTPIVDLLDESINYARRVGINLHNDE